MHRSASTQRSLQFFEEATACTLYIFDGSLLRDWSGFLSMIVSPDHKAVVARHMSCIFDMQLLDQFRLFHESLSLKDHILFVVHTWFFLLCLVLLLLSLTESCLDVQLNVMTWYLCRLVPSIRLLKGVSYSQVFRFWADLSCNNDVALHNVNHYL